MGSRRSAERSTMRASGSQANPLLGLILPANTSAIQQGTPLLRLMLQRKTHSSPQLGNFRRISSPPTSSVGGSDLNAPGAPALSQQLRLGRLAPGSTRVAMRRDASLQALDRFKPAAQPTCVRPRPPPPPDRSASTACRRQRHSSRVRWSASGRRQIGRDPARCSRTRG